MVKAKKKGEAGPAVNYVTRNKAIRTLQISLKDFRRLCILKGIYPRDPPKKKHGKDKTYYHIKDIKFLRHEPLLEQLRENKVRLRKIKRAEGKKDHARAARLKAAKPLFKVDHIIRERYPTFLDALRDLDDALCMVHLFAALPTKTVAYHDAVVSDACTRLVREFQSYVFASHALRKMFVSIKGMYYQAEIMGQTVTWLVPHKFAPNLPTDVDYRVMLTFLEFYTALLKFVLWKLYFELGFRYPPVLDESKDAKGEGLNLFKFESIHAAKPATAAAGAANAKPAAGELKDGTKAIGGVLKKIVAATAANASSDAAADATSAGAAAAVGAADSEAAGAASEDANGGADTQLFAKIDDARPESQTPAAIEESRVKKLFAGLVFYLAREVPGDSLEFVLLNGGARVVREDMSAPAFGATSIPTKSAKGKKVASAAAADTSAGTVSDATITHHVMDRPLQSHRLLTREYVQPQWVFDSFNTRALLPTAPYAPGAVPPPHLSPFVDDAKEGYVPKQRQVLEQWGAAANGTAAGAGADAAAAAAADAASADGGDDDLADGSESDNDHDLDQDELDAADDDAATADAADAAPAAAAKKGGASAYAQQLSAALNKQSGATATAAAATAAPTAAAADATGDDDDDDDDNADSDAEDEKVVVPAAGAGAKGSKRKSGAGGAASEEEMAKIMMKKKDARLYHRMQHGIQKKADANAALEARRQQIEAKTTKGPKTKKIKA